MDWNKNLICYTEYNIFLLKHRGENNVKTRRYRFN